MSPEQAAYIEYTVTLFIVLSFALKDLRKTRIDNLIGCIYFVQIYHLITGKNNP
ncbi:uroporphyrinogen decarboxylase [Chryseobacterium sp. CT-SW4]|uniref:uroporphyrinogen decarboxylase n=1 Tax=Chryseobacterium sp. SW-1 TaxID=3157343 RepID=UPI003B020A43